MKNLKRRSLRKQHESEERENNFKNAQAFILGVEVAADG